ncbi:MAG: recombinase family protein [Clostridiales bacterium]|nr:recombinase family protein [Clostridiales bacterium]
MARVSRRTNNVAVQASQTIPPQKVWRAGLYTRLSVIDTRKSIDSETLETQLDLLQNYADKHKDIHIVDTYCDNGTTGTNFDRQSFQCMMEDVRAGKINCIIVKDLSRFGRNFLETGNYLERIFPFMGVRFIAVNDGYDSESTDSGEMLSVALRNLMNDIYAKDISAKTYTAVQTKMKHGEFMGNHAPFGYNKSPEDKHKFVIDEYAAEVVRRIFRLYEDGNNYAEIARILTAENIPSPNHYMYLKGIVHSECYSQNIPWQAQMIRIMLSNQVYIGHMVQGKRTQKLFEDMPHPNYQSEKDLIIVEHTHPAIISDEQFNHVQQIISEKRAARKSNRETLACLGKKESIFNGMIVCEHCGYTMSRKSILNSKRTSVRYYYFCYVSNKNSSACSNGRYIREEKITDIVYQVIRSDMELLTEAEKIISRFRKNDSFNKQRILLINKIEETESKRKRISNLRKVLFEDYIQGIVNKDDFTYMSNTYESEEQLLTVEVERLKDEYTANLECSASDNKWYTAFQKFKVENELSRDMLTSLVEKIYVDSDKSVHVVLKYRDEMKKLFAYAEGMGDDNV